MMSDKKQLGELLVEEGRLSRLNLERALETQRLVGGRLGTNLLELGLVTADEILAGLALQRATRTFNESDLARISPQILASLPAKLAQRYRVLPVQLKGRTLSIASLDPGDPLKEDEISFMTSFMVRTCIALEAHLSLALQRYYKVPCDQRFLVLRRRQQQRLAAPRSSTLPAHAASSSSGTIDSAVLSSARKSRPAAVTAAGKKTPASSNAKAPEVEFIELDAEDAALLRRPGADTNSDANSDADAGDGLPAPTTTAITEPTAADELEALLDDTAPDPVAPQLSDPGLPVPASVPNMEPSSHEEPAPFEDTGTWDQALAQSLVTPEGRLAQAAKELQEADIRDEIGDVLLSFASVYFRRRLLFIARKERIVGWMGEGEGVDAERMRRIDLDARLPSVFSGLRQAESFWRGPLPALPLNHQLISAVGGEMPKECVALPVTLRSKVVCYLYGDNLDLGVSGTPMVELRRLVGKAGIAFEVYILKNKIRML